MSQKMLVILVAGVDIWAALFITQISQPRQPWEVSLAISDAEAPPAMTMTTPVQIWLRPDQVGLWPAMDQPLTVAQLRHHLQETATRNPDRRLEVRLLCDPRLTVQQWGRVAMELSAEAESIRIAPLPQPDG